MLGLPAPRKVSNIIVVWHGKLFLNSCGYNSYSNHPPLLELENGNLAILHCACYVLSISIILYQ